MKILCTLLIGLLACGSVRAQETYFNVPESEITEKNKILLQQQVDISERLRSSTTFNYGLGRNWEIGANLYNVNYQPDSRHFARNDSSRADPYAPLLLINAQKVFSITRNLLIGLGAQGGTNLTPIHNRSAPVGYAYVNLAGSFVKEHYKWSLGGYTGNIHYTGEAGPRPAGPRQASSHRASTMGIQAGYDAGIIYEKLHLIGDWISGQHPMGQLVVGVEVFLNKNFPLAVGWQRENRDGSQGVVVQLSYIPQN